MAQDNPEMLAQEALQRFLDVILLSRIPSIGDPIAEPRERQYRRVTFLLDMGNVDCIRDVLRHHWNQSKGGIALRVDVFRHGRGCAEMGMHNRPVM